MNTIRSAKTTITSRYAFTSVAGVSLIFFGVLILSDQVLKTGWLSLTPPFLAGLIMLSYGLRTRQLGLVFSGSIVSGYGAAGFMIVNRFFALTFQERLGTGLLLSGLGWLACFWLLGWVFNRSFFWALVPAGMSGGLGAWFLTAQIHPIDYVLYLPTAIGLTLLLCGILTHKLGLIIPGCLLVSIGPGVYFAWGQAGAPNGLAQTGIMLVTFSLGWGLITLFSKVVTDNFTWWPLIPGGVLAMVGWGLFIAGDPDNALSFIGNTGSVGLIIFGIYLLLWRNGFCR